MLVLTRKKGESLVIDDQIKVQVVEVKGKQVRIGIEAPKGIKICREEIYKEVEKENIKAAKSFKNIQSGNSN